MANLIGATKGRFYLTRPPRDDDELYELTKALWGTVIPRDKHCWNHQAPFDAFATAFFAREPQVLVRGSRGLSGKTAMMSCLGLTEGVVWGTDVNIVGGSEQQALNALAHMKRYWDYEGSPDYMLKQNNTQLMKLTNGSNIQPLTASEKSVRGPHPARLLLDEIDEMDESILESAKGQPMPQKNWLGVVVPQQTTMVSTLQYADGTMMKEMARFEEEGLPVLEWCYKDTMYAKDGWLSEEFVQQKKREVSRERWRVEYELGEPSIGNRAIDSDAVEHMFSLPAPEPRKQTREYEEWCYEDPRSDSDYVIAADWAKEVDWTIITVWKVTGEGMECVYFVRIGRRPYPIMVGIYNTLMNAYNAQAIHDGTGGGNVVKDLIDGRAWAFIMGGRDRDDMLSDFVGAVEAGKVKAPRIPFFHKEILYASVEDLYSRGKDYHLPDSFCSAALAWKVCGHRFPATAPLGFPKSDSNWMAKQVENNTEHLVDGSTWRDGDVTARDEDVEIFQFS